VVGFAALVFCRTAHNSNNFSSEARRGEASQASSNVAATAVAATAAATNVCHLSIPMCPLIQGSLSHVRWRQQVPHHGGCGAIGLTSKLQLLRQPLLPLH